MEKPVAPGPGTYVLALSLGRARTVQIGRLGVFTFKPGKYVYVGSAFGPGGLAARIAHHRRVAPRPRWHIDYLRTAAELSRVLYTTDPLPREHQWAGMFAEMQTAPDFIPGFGASDCRCRSHLYRFDKLPPLKDFKRHVYRSIPGHGPICGQCV